MRYWMAISLVVIACGFLPQLPSLYLLFTAFFSLFLASFYISRCVVYQRYVSWRRSENCSVPHVEMVNGWLPCVLVAFVAVIWVVVWGQAQLSARYPQALAKQNVHLTGCVDSLVEQKGISQRFVFRLSEPAPGLPVGSRVRLSFYGVGWGYGERFSTERQVNKALAAGRCSTLLARLKPPHGSVNPGAFDYQRWLLSRDINATGYVRREAAPVWKGDTWSIHHARERLGQWLDQALSVDAGWLGTKHNEAQRQETRALSRALLIGDRQLIDKDLKQLIERTGLSHLLAISGLHIGLAASFGFLLLGSIGRLLCVIRPLSVFTPRWQIAGAVVMATGYAILAGLSLPTQRALLMLLCFSFWSLSGRRRSPWLAWWVSMALVLLTHPLSGFDAGFWLSFIAVAALIAGFSTKAARGQGRIHQMWRAQWLVFVGLFLPLLLLGFAVSWHGLLVNLLAIPWVSITVVPPLLLGALMAPLSVPVAGEFWNLAAYTIGLMLDALRWWDDVSVVLLHNFSLPTEFGVRPLLQGFSWLAILLIAMALGLGLLLPKGLQGRGLVLLAALVVCGVGLQDVQESSIASDSVEAKVVVLDVGQGMSVVVQVGEEAWLIDAGARSASGFDSGELFVLPALRELGVKRIHTAVISHGDNDHSGGMASVAAEYPPLHWLLGEVNKFDAAPLSQNENRFSCAQDRTWVWRGLTIHVLGNPWADQINAKSNARSCVLLIECGHQRILLPGDIEARQERYFINHPKLATGVTGLLAPHHGSNTSSTSTFIEQLRPQWVVFSAGYLSRFGHPHPKVVARYRKVGTKMFNTADEGALILPLSGEWSYPVGWREQKPRFWY